MSSLQHSWSGTTIVQKTGTRTSEPNPRPIIHDPAVLDGRWHFAGTLIAVAEVRSDYYSARDDGDPHPYHYAGLTDKEVAAALSFQFPNMRDTTVEVEYASLTVHCTCGESTPATGVWPMISVVECPCRRRWRITVEPIPASH